MLAGFLGLGLYFNGFRKSRKLRQTIGIFGRDKLQDSVRVCLVPGTGTCNSRMQDRVEGCGKLWESLVRCSELQDLVKVCVR